MPLKTIKLTVSDEMLTQLDSQAETEDIPRAEIIRRAISGSLQPMKRDNYAKTCVDVLKTTNGKLTRLEAEHLVSVVIKGMAA